LQDLTTVDGTSIWAGDGVHLTSNATRVAAMKLMASIGGGEEKAEPANKRARMESVIPVKTTPLPAAKAAQPPQPSRPVMPRSGYLDSCQQTNTAICTREANSGGAGAAKVREEASRDL
jgi:hypothetical protein